MAASSSANSMGAGAFKPEDYAFEKKSIVGRDRGAAHRLTLSKRTGAGEVTWRSIDRVFSGERSPNTSPLKVLRAKSVP